MNTAVIKFNTLTDSVRTAAEYHYLWLVAYRALIFVKVIGRVVVCGVFCTAYMNAFPSLLNSEADTCISYLFFGYFEKRA